MVEGVVLSKIEPLQRHGLFLKNVKYKRKTPKFANDAERFMFYVKKTTTCPVDELPGGGCWLWRGARRNKFGHGGFTVRNRLVSSHRFAYEAFRHEAIPPGLVIDHLCNVPQCVNPWHLEAVTQAENTLRSLKTPSALNARKKKCPHGHLYTKDNIIWTCNRRVCRTCHTEKLRRFRIAHPEKMKEYKRRFRERHPTGI